MFGTVMVQHSLDIFIVDNGTLLRDGVSRPRFTIALVSPTARFAAPRGIPLDRVWSTPVYAKDAAEFAIGEAIQWELKNWLIPGDRLAVHNASLLDVVNTIAEAANQGALQTVNIMEDVVFSGGTTATLDKPVTEIVSATWLGIDLGDLTLGTDKRTLTVLNPAFRLKLRQSRFSQS